MNILKYIPIVITILLFSLLVVLLHKNDRLSNSFILDYSKEKGVKSVNIQFLPINKMISFEQSSLNDLTVTKGDTKINPIIIHIKNKQTAINFIAHGDYSINYFNSTIIVNNKDIFINHIPMGIHNKVVINKNGALIWDESLDQLDFKALNQ